MPVFVHVACASVCVCVCVCVCLCVCVCVCVYSVNLNAEHRAVRGAEGHIVEHIRIRLNCRLNYISRLLMQIVAQTVKIQLHIIELNLTELN